MYCSYTESTVYIGKRFLLSFLLLQVHIHFFAAAGLFIQSDQRNISTYVHIQCMQHNSIKELHLIYHKYVFQGINCTIIHWHLTRLRNTDKSKRLYSQASTSEVLHLHFTCMHLADAFIQATSGYTSFFFFFCQYMCSLGIEPTTFALLTQCSNHWATGTLLRRYYAVVHSTAHWRLWSSSHLLCVDTTWCLWSLQRTYGVHNVNIFQIQWVVQKGRWIRAKGFFTALGFFIRSDESLHWIHTHL